MALGELLFPVGYAPTDGGAVVPSGKLYFYRTGTTTAQDTFSDSALSTANANPVVLNSEGYLDTKVYGDPSTGFDYRIKFTTSADVQIWQVDDVVVPSRDVATIVEGSFTGTLTGMDAATTGTVNYTIVADDEGTGKLCTLYVENAITGTSNTTALTMTGLPAACQPSALSRSGLIAVTDNNVAVTANTNVSGGTVTFGTGAGFSASGFTSSGTKGLLAGTSITYPL